LLRPQGNSFNPFKEAYNVGIISNGIPIAITINL
jgi:hypothetical protein